MVAKAKAAEAERKVSGGDNNDDGDSDESDDEATPEAKPLEVRCKQSVSIPVLPPNSFLPIISPMCYTNFISPMCAPDRSVVCEVCMF